MTPAAVARLGRLCRLVASHAPAEEVEAELGARPDGEGEWAARVQVQSDSDGKVEFVHLELANGALTLEQLNTLGTIDPLPAAMAGDPSSHLLVVDDPAQPELCRVVIAAGPDEQVTTLSLQADVRL